MNDTERLIVAVKLLAEAVYNMSRNNGSPVNKLALRARDIADELAAVEFCETCEFMAMKQGTCGTPGCKAKGARDGDHTHDVAKPFEAKPGEPWCECSYRGRPPYPLREGHTCACWRPLDDKGARHG